MLRTGAQPAMIAQTNQLVRVGRIAGSPDRSRSASCHAPLGAALTDQATLPFDRALYSDDLLNEGISCSVCHQYTGKAGIGVVPFMNRYADVV
jgi:hypothetical protein